MIRCSSPFLSLLTSISIFCFSDAVGGSDIGSLPLIKNSTAAKQDYLIDGSPFQAIAGRNATATELVLENGLVRRTWRLAPNAACVGFDNLMTGEAMLRSVRPEARVTIDGVSYEVGGLVGQPNHAFLKPEWLDAMTAKPQAMRLINFEIGQPSERFAWGRRRHAAPDAKWPPAGVSLRMDYAMPAAATDEKHQPTREQAKQTPQIQLSIHYEMYDGVPVMCKWITVHNESSEAITVDRIVSEELALVEHDNRVETRAGSPISKPDYLHVETDFAFGSFENQAANRHVVHWRIDPLYTTQVNYARQTPCLLVAEPTYGPAQSIEAGGTFEGFRVFELAFDRADRERRGLALRRMYRTVAPWVTENPLTHHLLSNDVERVRQAIEAAADVGFEAIILSFGSGFDMEERDEKFLAQWKSVADLAEQRGIELGCYSLFSSRNVGERNMIVSPAGQQPTHGQCPAVTSEWGLAWLAQIRDFYDQTGFDQFENDGPYPGDIDVTARPPLQNGIKDSRWVQWRLTTDLYRALRQRGVYINAPDYYYLSGSNKCGMGYREVNWSLPRAEQVIHTRQNIYDGTWEKTPSMGWMFVPLSQYHGGGAEATVEPLHEHLDHYQRMMHCNLGMGVQAHYRGPKLFDTDQTRAMVRDSVSWFKKYRNLLESDIIHGRRADGRDLDWVLHVNPDLETAGMLCVYNPLSTQVTKTLRVNLYYTGLRELATMSEQGSDPKEHSIPRDYTIDVEVTVPAAGMNWFVISSPGPK